MPRSIGSSPCHMAAILAAWVILGWLPTSAQAADALHDLVAGLAAGETPTPVLVADGFQFTEGPVADAALRFGTTDRVSAASGAATA